MKLKSKILLGIIVIFGLLSASFIFGIFLFIRPIQVVGHSMEPNYVNGDKYLVLVNFPFEINSNDVVYYRTKDNKSIYFIGRVIGLPGESALVNNKQQIITNESYYILGDNREKSLDSSTFGFIPKTNIEGKILFNY